MATYNYIRVSTITQNTERQLKDIPCDIEFLEKVSAKDTKREQLQLMLKIVKPGDLINVHELSRLARNTQDLLTIVDDVVKKGARIKFHKENLTFDGTKQNDGIQKLMLTMLAAFSTFERDIMLARQREGIAIAKEKGKYKGRKARISQEQIEEMKKAFPESKNKSELARQYGITRSYLYQLVRV